MKAAGTAAAAASSSSEFLPEVADEPVPEGGAEGSMAAGKKRAAEAEAPALAPKAAKVAWDPLAGLMEGGSADEDSSSDEEGAQATAAGN